MSTGSTPHTKELYSQKKRILWLSPDRAITKILLFVAISGILLLAWVVVVHGKNSFDQEAFNFVAPYITNDLTSFMSLITFLGDNAFLIPASLVCLLYFLIKKDKWAAIAISFISLGGHIIKILLKEIFRRLRPDDSLLQNTIAGFSFPSGHAMLSVTFYGFLAWLAAHSIRHRLLQKGVISVLLLLILIISFSRIYLRVHYATDVIAGLCLGFVWLSFCFWFIDKKQLAAGATPAHQGK